MLNNHSHILHISGVFGPCVFCPVSIPDYFFYYCNDYRDSFLVYYSFFPLFPFIFILSFSFLIFANSFHLSFFLFLILLTFFHSFCLLLFFHNYFYLSLFFYNFLLSVLICIFILTFLPSFLSLFPFMSLIIKLYS